MDCSPVRADYRHVQDSVRSCLLELAGDSDGKRNPGIIILYNNLCLVLSVKYDKEILL